MNPFEPFFSFPVLSFLGLHPEIAAKIRAIPVVLNPVRDRIKEPPKVLPLDKILSGKHPV